MSCEGFCKTIPCTCKEMWDKACDSMRKKQMHKMAESMAGIVIDKLVNSMGIQGHRDMHSKLGEMPKGSVLHPDVCCVCLQPYSVCDCNDKWNNPEASKQTTGKLQDESVKQTNGKRRWKFLPWNAVERVVQIREQSIDGKYPDPEGWRSVSVIDYVDAIQRHLLLIRRGEEFDSESGFRHAEHIACTALFISEILAGDKPLKVGNVCG